MNNSNSLFSNAIKQVKGEKSTFNNPVMSGLVKSKLYSSNMDEEIDFARESKNIGRSPSKLRSTITREPLVRENDSDFAPYKKSLSFVKKNNGTPNKIILNKRITKDNQLDKIIVKKDNSQWKHDLFVDDRNNSHSDYEDKDSNPSSENYVVFVRNLPRYMTKSKLMDYFSKYGDIIGLNVYIK